MTDFSNTSVTQDISLEDLATRPFGAIAAHVWYPAFARDIPDVLVVRWPDGLPRGGQRTGLNAAYKAVFVETSGDRRAAEDALTRPLVIRDGIVRLKETLDLPNVRRSSLPRSRDLRMLHYAPPDRGWPHLVVLMSGMVLADPGLVRGRYLPGFHATEEHVVEYLKSVSRAAGIGGLGLKVGL